MSIREFKESPWVQGDNERLSYTVDTSDWGGSPTSPVVTLYQLDGAGVKTSIASSLFGSATVSGDSIITPLVIDLTADIEYRMEVRWTYLGNVKEAYGIIRAEE